MLQDNDTEEVILGDLCELKDGYDFYKLKWIVENIMLMVRTYHYLK